MAKRRRAPRDNQRTVTLGDMTVRLEESLLTGITYRNEFFGKLERPYKGILGDDLLTVWSVAQPTVSVSEIDEDGNESEATRPNPDYAGHDTEAVLRIAWAMARAAGSTDATWDEFFLEAAHQPASITEEASLYATVVLDLGARIIFRKPEGRGGAGEADEAQGQGA